MRHTLGTSLLAIRSVSAVAGAALVVLTGLLARELGGGRFAMGLSALASGLAFVYVVKHYLFTMNALEPLFWTGCAFLVVRIVKMGDQRLRLGFGLLAGLGLQKKYSTAVYGLGLVVGLVLSPEREAFRKPWTWLGGTVAALVFLPNVVWNVRPPGPEREPGEPPRVAGRPRLAAPLEAGTRVPPAGDGLARDARRVHPHEGQGRLCDPGLRHPLRRGRRRPGWLHRRGVAHAAAARPRPALRPDPALPALRPAASLARTFSSDRDTACG